MRAWAWELVADSASKVGAGVPLGVVGATGPGEAACRCSLTLAPDKSGRWRELGVGRRDGAG